MSMNSLRSTDYSSFHQSLELMNQLMENQVEQAERERTTEQDLITFANHMKNLHRLVKDINRTKVARVSREVHIRENARNSRRRIAYTTQAKRSLGVNQEKGYVICELCDSPIKKAGLKNHQKTTLCQDKLLCKVGCNNHKKVIDDKIIYEKLLGSHLLKRKQEQDMLIRLGSQVDNHYSSCQETFNASMSHDNLYDEFLKLNNENITEAVCDIQELIPTLTNLYKQGLDSERNRVEDECCSRIDIIEKECRATDSSSNYELIISLRYAFGRYLEDAKMILYKVVNLYKRYDGWY